MGDQSGVRSGWGLVGGSTNVVVVVVVELVTQELKVRHFTINNIEKYENGGPQPSRVIENERKLEEIGKNCESLSGFEPRTLKLEFLHLTARFKLQNGVLQNIQTEITRKKKDIHQVNLLIILYQLKNVQDAPSFNSIREMQLKNCTLAIKKGHNSTRGDNSGKEYGSNIFYEESIYEI